MGIEGELMITLEEIIHDIEFGISEFGRYTYYDKGPSEVCHIYNTAFELKTMEISEIVELLEEVYQHQHGPKYVATLLSILDILTAAHYG
jgi:hypothetical protein